jgi:hypothetical protein
MWHGVPLILEPGFRMPTAERRATYPHRLLLLAFIPAAAILVS